MKQMKAYLHDQNIEIQGDYAANGPRDLLLLA